MCIIYIVHRLSGSGRNDDTNDLFLDAVRVQLTVLPRANSAPLRTSRQTAPDSIRNAGNRHSLEDATVNRQDGSGNYGNVISEDFQNKTPAVLMPVDGVFKRPSATSLKRGSSSGQRSSPSIRGDDLAKHPRNLTNLPCLVETQQEHFQDYLAAAKC